MKAIGYLAAVVIYIAAVLYLLMGALGIGFGVRIAGNMFAEEGLGFQRTNYLVLLLLLLCGGFYSLWLINRRPA